MMQKQKAKKQNNLIWLGTIVNTHGLKGEVRILTNSDDITKTFAIGTEIFLENNQKLIIKSYRSHRNFVLVIFEGIDIIEKAEKLKGKKIYRISTLNPEEEFYLKDLIDAKVINNNDQEIGTVIDLLHQIAYDSIIIKLKTNNKIINIPLIDEFFVDFDATKKIVYVKLSKEFINMDVNY
ncbi:/ rimM / Ribosome maturation factor rimM /:158336 Forward [Candidatus Hepatoplasma crinochetorum]|uniref:Ribosome maturation factor RimM n=1 Tax=Candidatus Hepatoplasma crinochetorum TaxID=295596 RepID=A0A0G7ZNH4_9MOLU|nr:/ rimM / Ribosome maturation factor rimM /:158336 Forward [Candidatus Hepatoplasma crinochetorum]